GWDVWGSCRYSPLASLDAFDLDLDTHLVANQIQLLVETEVAAADAGAGAEADLSPESGVHAPGAAVVAELQFDRSGHAVQGELATQATAAGFVAVTQQFAGFETRLGVLVGA